MTLPMGFLTKHRKRDIVVGDDASNELLNQTL